MINMMANFNALSACPMPEQDHMKIEAWIQSCIENSSWDYIYKTETIVLLKMEMVPSNNWMI